MNKLYHALIPGHIYCGGANDIQQMVDEDGISVVIDLRAESTGCAAHQPEVQWVHIPLSDHPALPEEQLYSEAIKAIVDAYQDGQKVAFHCGAGRGRTGTVAAGVLLELKISTTIPEAVALAKSVRPVLNIKPIQYQALGLLYPEPD
ncbi:dual specificity protein phosphatase family protein [Enterobacter kobei]|nr:dual specificity protein phosphatase family protein [Enterobacter kobei]